MSRHEVRRMPGGLAAALTVVVVFFVLLLIAPPARADLPQAPDALPQIWGVEVDSALLRDLDGSLARRLHAAGAVLLANRDGLSPAARERLEAFARRWDLRVFLPRAVHGAADGATAAVAASDCLQLKRSRLGSRCGVQADSAADAAVLARADATDVVVVRAQGPRAFARLGHAAGSSRMLGILRLTERSYRPARWRRPIRSAQRSERLDLVVRPAGRGRKRALARYLAQLSRVAQGDRVPPTQPQGLAVSATGPGSVTLAWKRSRDNDRVAGYGVYRDGVFIGSVRRPSARVGELSCESHLFEVDAVDRADNRSAKSFVAGTPAGCDAPGPAPASAPALTSPAQSPVLCADGCPAGEDTEAPSVPPNQRYTSIGKTTVTLAWDAATDDRGVTGYHLYRDGARVASTPDLSYAYAGLDCGTAYTFALEAYDAAGNVSDRRYATGSRTTQACDEPPPSDPPPSDPPPTDPPPTDPPPTDPPPTDPPPPPVDPPPPGDGLANLWVDGNGGTCTRSPAPVAYVDAAACGSAAQAYNVANGTTAGSTVLIRGGTYPSFELVGSRSSANRIVFDAAPGEKPVFTGGYLSLGDGQTATTGPDYVTLRNLTTAQFGLGNPNPDNRYGVYVGQGSSFVRLENLRAGNFLIQGSQNIEVIGGEYGPCRASDQGQECEINKVDHYPGAPQPKNILIDGVYFHDYDLGPSCFQPSDGGNSTGNPDCHWRAMYLNGVHDLTLRNSRFRESFIAPWMTISGPDAARVGNKNILVENNVFGTGVNYGNPGRYNQRGYGRWEAFDFAWCQNASSGVLGYENVTFRFNSSSRAVGLFTIFDEVGCQGKVRNVRSYGNVGFRNGCDPLVEYRYNVYANSGTCDPTDRNANAGGALPFYANDTHSPGPDDYALTGPAAAPDNLVPASMGCPATDRNGRARGQGGFCDAGAYER